MKWDEFKDIGPEEFMWERRSKTDIECPKCKEKVFRRNDIVLTSYPAQYQYECDKCGWIGYAFR